MNPSLPAHAVLPDYAGGSILNLTASIAAAFGARLPYPTLRLLPPELLRRRSSVLLIVVDGLGYRYLCDAHPSSLLYQSLRGNLTSVFPSTTATAITTFMTGLAPSQHGLTGWHMYLEEADAIGAILPFRVRATDEALTHRGLQPTSFFDHVALYDRLPVRSYVISPERIVNSDFNAAHSGRAERRGYGSTAQFFQVIEACLRAQDERKLVYAYFPELDSTAHERGIGSQQATDVLRRFDEGFARLLSAIAGYDVTVIVCADHGFVDAPEAERIELDQHPFLAECLARPLCGEQRVAYCYVQPDKAATFEAYVRHELGDRITLVDSRSAIEAGWFGPGEPHPRLASRIGDYILLLTGCGTIKDWMPGEKRYTLVGVHGGVSEHEMQVPLIVVTP